MTKPATETKPTAAQPAPPLSPSVRRHLGKTLRSHFADCLTEPVGERLGALIASLGKPQR